MLDTSNYMIDTLLEFKAKYYLCQWAQNNVLSVCTSLRPWSFDSLDGGSTDEMEIPPL